MFGDCNSSYKKVLTEAEIKVLLKKGFGYAPNQNKFSEPELCSDVEEFCRRIRLKCYFCKYASPIFSKEPSFTYKSLWKPSIGHSNIEVLPSELETEI